MGEHTAPGSRHPAELTDAEPPISHVLLSGGIGGALGDSSMYPLDTIKTRQQGISADIVLKKYRTTGQAFKTILREEGFFKGLYRGYTAMVLGSFPSTMLFFGSYEALKRNMIENTNLNETVIHLTSGFFGDLVSSFVYVPSEVVKTRLQVQGPYNPALKTTLNGNVLYNYKGLYDAVFTILKNEGAGTLFYGYRATLIRDLPFSALQLAFYERFRKSAQYQAKSTEIGLGMELFVGGAAGGLAGMITTPLDVIKTRIQTQTKVQIHGTFSGLKSIFAAEGLVGVFGGVVPRFVWTSIQSSVMLLLYQSSLRVLRGN
ncbi:Mme1 protein [Starmerella bacillaris]|uniref:Mme1 protein n=1 Tax=Starmerella bacillaris TaxID=1247836 RepID=A0AAV5RGL8_STABA|nr:Mme1 protein [Starmerella bacillaris]